MSDENRHLGAALAVALGIISAVLSGSSRSYAQDANGVSIHYHQFYGQGFASDAEVQSALGDLSFSITSCENSWLGHIKRSVQVSATGSDYSNQRVVEAVLYRAVVYAWSNCPLGLYFGAQLTNNPRYDVASVDLFLADGTHAIRAVNMFGDRAQSAGSSYAWQEVSDTGAIDRASAAAMAAQAEQQQAQAAAQADQQAQQAAADAARQQASEQWWSNAWQTIKRLLWIAVFVTVAVWLLRHWEMFVRWYYLLTPHPAADMVHAAVYAGVDLDGEAFNEILRPLPGGRIEKEVRQQQALKLAELARASSVELARRAEELRQKSREDAAYQAAHRELHDSTIEQQLSALRAEALAKIHAFMNREKAH